MALSKCEPALLVKPSERTQPVEIAVVELPRAAPAKTRLRFDLQGRATPAGERTRYIETNAGNGVFIAYSRAGLGRRRMTQHLLSQFAFIWSR